MNANQIARIRSTIQTGMQFGSIDPALDIDQVVAHVVRISEFCAAHNNVNLNWQRFPMTVTDEELTAAAEAKNKRNKRSAGARALSAKYGKDAAERIIAEKTGRHINLQR